MRRNSSGEYLKNIVSRISTKTQHPEGVGRALQSTGIKSRESMRAAVAMEVGTVARTPVKR